MVSESTSVVQSVVQVDTESLQSAAVQEGPEP